MSAAPFVRPDVRALLDAIAAAPNAPKMSEVGPVESRAMMRQMGTMFEVPVGDLAVIRDLAMPSPAGGEIALRLYDVRETRGPGPVVVFYHGGGFVIGDLDCYDPGCAEISRLLDLPVVSVDYRLAPEYPWPAATDDCEAAARWVASSPALLGRPATGIINIGDSAGGGLTIVTSMALRDKPAQVPVLAQWALYPVADVVTERDSHKSFGSGYLLEQAQLLWFYSCYGVDEKHWHASLIDADQTGMPPTLVTTCSLDPLRDEGRAYAAAVIESGVPTIFREAEGMIHGFLSLRKALPSGQDDLAAGAALLKMLLSENMSRSA